MSISASTDSYYNAAEDLLGRNLLAGRGDKTAVIDKNGEFYTQSDAALRVAATLEKPALNALATAFTPLPSPLRNGVYRLVANNCYSILGKDESGGPESCKLRADSAVVANRFLG